MQWIYLASSFTFFIISKELMDLLEGMYLWAATWHIQTHFCKLWPIWHTFNCIMKAPGFWKLQTETTKLLVNVYIHNFFPFSKFQLLLTDSRGHRYLSCLSTGIQHSYLTKLCKAFSVKWCCSSQGIVLWRWLSSFSATPCGIVGLLKVRVWAFSSEKE